MTFRKLAAKSTPASTLSTITDPAAAAEFFTQSLMASYGVRSPPPPPPDAPSPRPQFDSETLKAYIKKLLSTTLQTEAFPAPRDRDKLKAWCKEIGERVKERMLEIQSKGFKYIVLTRIDGNSGQGMHANLICHWEDCDAVAQEMFSNDSLICICVAFAIRTV